MHKIFKKKKLWTVLTCVFTPLLAICLLGSYVANMFSTQINASLKLPLSKLKNASEDTYYTSSWDDKDALAEYEKELCIQLEGEGATLLKNEGNALPLSIGDNISLFSQSSINFVYGGTGSGSVNTADASTLKEALESEGLNVNPVLDEFYKNTSLKRKTPKVVGGYSSDYLINEVDVSEYTNTVKNSFSEYGDAAIVVLSRSGGEGSDLPFGEDVIGCEDGGSDSYYGDYLRLSSEERDLFEMISGYRDDGVIKKVIVLLNSANTIQLDFLDEYSIDALLWVGDVGQYGMEGVAKILAGEINPSGRLVDTFLKDNHSSPAMSNFGVYEYSNADELKLGSPQNNANLSSIDKMNSRYIAYLENIYVGYRYYETRYEDYVMGEGNAGEYEYYNDVAFPFGFGLSYGSGDFEYSNFNVTYQSSDDCFEISLDVSNNSGLDGKHTVQIYMQSPYTDYDKENGVEKASVELCGFSKISLSKGETKSVTISVDREELTSYDSNTAKTYILDEGNYYFTAAKSAHNAVNNILAAKGYTPSSSSNKMDENGDSTLVATYLQEEFDAVAYSTSSTGYEVTNLFDDADLNKYEGSPSDVTYLSRSDWANTFPKNLTDLYVTEQMWHDGLAQDSRAIKYPGSSKSGHDERMSLIEEYKEKYGNDNATSTLSNGNIQLIELMNASYDDPRWDNLLDQASYKEMTNLIYNGFHMTQPISSIGLPYTMNENGPQGYTASVIGGKSGMCYTSEDIMAATYNIDLISKVGECIGEDCLLAGASGIYAPGANIHRTPYSGRNFEYYSEDSYLSGVMASSEIKAIQLKGVFVYIKHFALNEQENGRYGLSTFANEQTIREIYLEPFKKAVEDGGAKGVMTSLNRIGVTWSGANYNLMTEVLRNEWGFDGITITDCSLFSTAMDCRLGLLAGQNIWDGYTTFSSTKQLEESKNDTVMVNVIKESVKRVAYTVLHSNAMNNIDENTKVVTVTPWWKSLMYSVDIVLAVFSIASITMLCISVHQNNKSKQKEENI